MTHETRAALKTQRRPLQRETEHACWRDVFQLKSGAAQKAKSVFVVFHRKDLAACNVQIVFVACPHEEVVPHKAYRLFLCAVSSTHRPGAP